MNASGSYSAWVPLDLPTARGGLAVPVQITYSDRGVGAAGRGWDVPLSYIRRDTTIVHRRPVGTANVAPQAREQVTLVLDGRTLSLVQTASGWSARRDAADLDIRQLDAATWVVYDGQGRTYTFSSMSAVLAPVGMWLLQDITGVAGSRVHLDYNVTTPIVAGNTVLAIDLTSVRYNQHPTVADCYKTTISLAYDGDVDPPIAAAVLGTTMLVRKHKLTQLDVLSKESCTSSDVRLRRWQLNYAPDADTQQPRLTTVTLSGRDGTTEAGTPTLVASYAYASASTAGQLAYQAIPQDPHSQPVFTLGQRIVFGAPVVPMIADGLYTTDLMADVTGDGRADAVHYTAGLLDVYVNRSATGSWDFSGRKQLSDDTLSALQPEWRSTQKPAVGTTAVVYDQVWRQAIDVNGDGRVDIVDAGMEAGYWTVYLSTPDPADPSDTEGVHWVKRKYEINTLRNLLTSRGLATQGDIFLPLSRRAVGSVGLQAECWQWVAFDPRARVGNATRPRPTGSWQFVANPPAGCIPSEPPLQNNNITEWEMKDINGDGYPDVVFSSSVPVLQRTVISDGRTPTGSPGDLAAVIISQTLVQQAGAANKIEAVLGVLGTHLAAGGSQPFSTPVTLSNQEPCGIEQLVVDGPGAQHVQCGLADVNGDGIIDRVDGTSVRLGLGSTVNGSFFSSGPMLTLPGPLAATTNNQLTSCSPGSRFAAQQTNGLLDMNGDGIPDYVSSSSTHGSWNVSLGTGTSFATPLLATSALTLPVTSEDCAGAIATSVAGMVDLDGDGKPEAWDGNGNVFALVGPDGSIGAPGAGRLVQIDDLLGARTTIAYRSSKADGGGHRVPMAEVVVGSVGVTGTKGRGGDLSRTMYAYAGADLLFDPVLDRFTFPGYRRTAVLQSPDDPSAMTGRVTITDNYAPASVLDPYGISGGTTPDAGQRYTQSLRFGRPRDVTVLSGAFGAGTWDPSSLLGLDVTSDSRRIAGTHYDWDARNLSVVSDPSGAEPCVEPVYPYDYESSLTFATRPDHFDPCVARGFAHMASVQSWRGTSGDPTSRVESRSEVTDIDDLGRILSIKNSNDVHRDDDDVCMRTEYAVPTGANERVLSAQSSLTISDCANTVYAKDSWEYDHLPSRQVAAGLVSSQTVERHDDSGTLIGTVRRFDTTYDGDGNPQTVTMTREDGATRTVTALYNDAFHLAISGLSIQASGLPTSQISFARDPLTLLVTEVTDPNGTKRGATFDGFDRRVLETVTPPGGSQQALAVNAYKGFPGQADPAGLGPRIGRTTFADPVDLATALDAAAASPSPARTSTAFLDELGREYRSEFTLGNKYDNQTMNSRRIYDGLGRVVFEADPYPSTQGAGTAYGTTSFFNTDGTLSCTVRGSGQQSTVPAATDEAQLLYPTCMQRTFQDYTEVVTTQDAASYLTGSPQEGVKNISALSAIGRVIARSTMKAQDRIEHATFSYDRLGHMTGMTRYQDAPGASKTVSWSWHYDSLGQLLELDEPESVPRYNAYSSWGELVDVSRQHDTSQVGPPDSTHGSHVIARYDALGRVNHREEQHDGVTDPETINDYFYDQGVNTVPQVTPTNVLGRLSQATWPTGSVSFSYDDLGRVNARVFMDTTGRSYIEKHTFFGDGAPKLLDMFLPDTGYAKEEVTYGYDSAGRGNAVSYDGGLGSQTLYAASRIDAFGRVRDAQYGLAAFSADYADVGRRLLNQVTVSSMAGSRAISFAGYDPIGRERSRTETKNGISPATTSHTYDALGRLSSSIRTSGTTTLFNQQFTYDPLGNLLSQSDGVGGPAATNTRLSYLDSDRDRICRVSFGTDSDTACNVTYDEVGSITSMPSAGGTRHYSYLADGSVRTIEDDHATAHFRYDAFGDVQELDVTTGGVPSVPDARSDQRYGNVFAWHDEIIGGTRSRVLLRTVPGPDGFVATRHGAGGAWTFTFGEARGSRFLTDENGTFVQDVDYEPFGKITSTGAQPGDPLYSSWQWNGGDSLAAFGVSQLGARIYDPAIGRFLSRDPLVIPQTAATTNPYAFADNDPINGSDPDGLCARFVDAIECPELHNEGRSGGEPVGLAGSGFAAAEAGGPRDDRPKPKLPSSPGPNYADQMIQWQKDLLAWTLASQAANAAREERRGFGGLARGLWSGTKGMVTGVAHMVRHPVDTVVGLAHMARHPIDTTAALAHVAYAAASSCLSGDTQTCGVIAINAGSLVLGGGALRAVSKIGKVAEIGEVAEVAQVAEAAGGVTRAIGATGRVGEEALRALGGESQVFFRTSRGGRFIDQLVAGVAHESKVGYTSLTRSIARQIAKDAELIATEQVKGATWHFFKSPVTGLGGPSAPLRQALERAGIGIVIH